LLIVLAVLPFLANAQVSVTATAGTPGPVNYPVLKLAFDAINAGTHQGDITIIISANTAEPATAALNGSGTGAASYAKVLIKPAPGTSPVVSGSTTNASIILLKGASNVRIDGSNNGTTSRDLTITNTAGRGNVINIASVGTTPITDVSVLNTNIINSGTTTGNVGIAVGGSVTNSSNGYFNNIALINNVVKRTGWGISLRGVLVPQNGAGCWVVGNQLDAGGTDAIRNVGIFTWQVTGVLINANKIGNFDGVNGSELDSGVLVDIGSNNITVSNNVIYNLICGTTPNSPAYAIVINTNIQNSAVTVTENTITNIGTNSDGPAVGLAMLGSSAGITFSCNKVSKIWSTDPTVGAAGIWLNTTWAGGDASKVYNNFISDIAAVGMPSSGFDDNAYGVVVLGPGPYQVDYNTVVMTPNNLRGNSDWSAAMLISDRATIGSIESMRNNIFVNQQASSGSNSKPAALFNASAAGIFAFTNIDHNDYYSTSGILVRDGATDAANLTQLQALLGGNANSKNIMPNFVSATDFHLSLTGNAGIENAGTPVIGITSDIDKESRHAVTPDMGADELVCNAPAITTPPGPQTVGVGDNASFSVTATGTGPLSYQWEVNDGSGFTPITNNATYSNAATATLNVTSAALNMNGYLYRCVVTGACIPATTSVDALLTVAILPQQLSFQTQTAASTITVTYGDPVINAAASASSGLPVAYTSSIPAVGTVDAAGLVTIRGAGTTTITVSQPGNPRYAAAADITITLVVNKKDLLLTADDKTRPEGTPNPALTIRYNGFVNGENATAITIPNIATTATVNSAMGVYPIQLTGGAAANYKLILTDGTLTITAPVLTILQEPVDAEVCERTSAIFSVTANNMPGITWQWQESSNGSSWQNINGAVNNSYTAPGTITRMLRCEVKTAVTTLYTRTIQFTIHPSPKVQATVTGYTDCSGASIQLNASGASTYEWSPMQHLNDAYTAHPIASPPTNTLYTVEGRDAFGCRATAQVQVDVRKNNGFKMASAFTPNGDGNNDCFGIRSWGMLQKVDFNIYNRYGMLVFHTDKSAECWDGKLKGVNQSTGTYVYYIVAVTECGVLRRKGAVALIR